MDELYRDSTARNRDGLPSIELLQPLSIHLERASMPTDAPTTSTVDNDASNDHVDDVEQILKVIKKEFSDENVLIIDDESDIKVSNVSNAQSPAEETEKSGMNFHIIKNISYDAYPNLWLLSTLSGLN